MIGAIFGLKCDIFGHLLILASQRMVLLFNEESRIIRLFISITYLGHFRCLDIEYALQVILW